MILFLKSLRFTPFDTSTESGRTAERYRRAAFSILANILSKGLGMLLMLLSVRLTVPYLGVERFGVWVTISSFAGVLTLLDMGAGNALTNHVAQRAAKDDGDLLSKTISGGLAYLAALGLISGALLFFVATVIPWGALIKVTNPELILEARNAGMCFAVLFGLNMFTSGIQRVFAGLQRAFEAHLSTALGSLISIVSLYFAAESRIGISGLLFLVLGIQSLTTLFLLALLIKRDQFRFSGILKYARIETPYLLKSGGLFFILQIGTMVGWGADSLIISSTIGATQVAIYGVTKRIFQIATQPIAMITAPLWGAYADAHARGQTKFIKDALKRSMLLTVFMSVAGALVILLCNEWIIQKVTADKIIIPLSFIWVFAFWSILEACGNSFAMFMNGCNIIRPQVVTVILLSIVSLPAKFIAVKHFGVEGVVGVYALLFAIIVFTMYGIYFRKEIAKGAFV